jgi:hypothetical protein
MMPRIAASSLAPSRSSSASSGADRQCTGRLQGIHKIVRDEQFVFRHEDAKMLQRMIRALLHRLPSILPTN